MKGKMSNEMGDIVIDREVLAKYAGSAATECFGIVGMASVNVKDGVTKLLKRENDPIAGVAELADAPDLGSGGNPCRFKSCRPH